MPAIITANKEDKVQFKGIDKLPQTKSKNGFLYTLIKRNAKAAIYSQVNEKFPEDKSVGYEVFLITLTKPCAIMQKNGSKKGMWYHYPETEKFPGNEDFGKFAWSYSYKNAAMDKYKEISK